MSIYYATPGYQMGAPRASNSSNTNYGTYIKRLTNSTQLVLWFADKSTYASLNDVASLLLGETKDVEAFFINGYFQDSSLQSYKEAGGTVKNLIDLKTSSNSEWKAIYNKIPSASKESYCFYGLTLDSFMSFTKGKREEIIYKRTQLERAKVRGGYTERLPFSSRLSSNQQIDMLEAWRKVCYSGNPKLLKDNKGQKFLIQIVSASNTPSLDNEGRMPETINFSWVEIGSAKNITVTGQRED